jgi:hypothetical protein
MRIGVDNAEFDATPENTKIFTGSTLINSIYVDFPEDYVVIPPESDGYDDVVLALIEEGIESEEVHRYDPNAQPFCFIINALCRTFRKELDDLKIDG